MLHDDDDDGDGDDDIDDDGAAADDNDAFGDYGLQAKIKYDKIQTWWNFVSDDVGFDILGHHCHLNLALGQWAIHIIYLTWQFLSYALSHYDDDGDDEIRSNPMHTMINLGKESQ